MYCSHCGIKIEDDAAICPHCYAKQKPIKQNDTGALGYGLLSILVPIAGLVFYLIWKKERPKTAKVSLICAIFRSTNHFYLTIHIICFWNVASCCKYWMIGDAYEK